MGGFSLFHRETDDWPPQNLWGTISDKPNRWWKCKTWQLFRLLNWIIHSLPFTIIDQFPKLGIYCQINLYIKTMARTWGENETFKGRLGKVLPDANGEADVVIYPPDGFVHGYVNGENNDTIWSHGFRGTHGTTIFRQSHLYMHKNVQTSENHWELSFHMTI